MATYDLPYGKKYLQVEIPSKADVEIIAPITVTAADDPLLIVKESLDQSDLEKYKMVNRVAIAVNDKTRPVPHEFLLPPLLTKLKEIGVKTSNVQFLIATGTHLPMPANEYPLILPKQILEQSSVQSHDCDDIGNLVNLGQTSHGTPVYVNRLFFKADLKIVVGNLEPHHFMGFSGGVKSASIGLAGRRTININHAMLVDPMAKIAEYKRNPMRQDVEEIGQMIGVDFALNAILNQDKQIVEILAGNPRKVMEGGIPIARQICQVNIAQLFDVVIASVGGYPKDINLYQSQKALSHACLIAKDGGTVILVAECIEGSGSKGFEEFMKDVHTFKEVLDKFNKQEFQIGPHKAFQIAQQGARVNIILVSSMPDTKVLGFLLTPASSIHEALQIAITKFGSGLPTIAIMPRATNTIPNIG